MKFCRWCGSNNCPRAWWEWVGRKGVQGQGPMGGACWISKHKTTVFTLIAPANILFNTTTDESDVACAPRRRARQASLSLGLARLAVSLSLSPTFVGSVYVCVGRRRVVCHFRPQFQKKLKFPHNFPASLFCTLDSDARSRPRLHESTAHSSSSARPVPQPCSALADSPLLVGTCSVTHSSSSDSSCAFHIFACASCHLCHRNISNTCHSTGVWWEVRSVLCCAMVWWGCWLRVVGWGVARPLWPHSRFRFA